MKKLFYFLAIIIHGIINAQVGIKTDNPQATLDVNGNVRIDRLDYIKDFKDNSNYLLISDETNIVKKINADDFNISTKNPILAVLHKDGYSGNSVGRSGTGTYIDLPKGTWIVQASLLLKCTSFKMNTAQWVRSTFSDTQEGNPSQDILSGSFISGAIIGPSEHSTINGSIIIRNSSDNIKRYFLVKINMDFYYENYGTVNSSSYRCRLQNFGSNHWSENNIFATPL